MTERHHTANPGSHCTLFLPTPTSTLQCASTQVPRDHASAHKSTSVPTPGNTFSGSPLDKHRTARRALQRSILAGVPCSQVICSRISPFRPRSGGQDPGARNALGAECASFYSGMALVCNSQTCARSYRASAGSISSMVPGTFFFCLCCQNHGEHRSPHASRTQPVRYQARRDAHLTARCERSHAPRRPSAVDA